MRFCSFVGADVTIGPAAYTTGGLALNIQAREWNRREEHFSPHQAPGGAGGNRGAPLKFPRAGRSPPHQRDDPRKWGGGGGGDLEHRNGAPWSRPPGAFLVSFWASKRKLAACRRRNFPAKKGKTARRVVAQASFSCPYGAIHLLAPYEKRNHCLLPAGGGTPCA